jgi:hypothetical protein
VEAWGSSRSAWLYSAKATRGFFFPWGDDLHATSRCGALPRQHRQALSHEGALFRYFGPQSRQAAFYGSIALDRLGTAAAPDQLQLGGDTGLRGYPLRYQEGEKRALFTLEQRVYTDWYLFRLVRVAARCSSTTGARGAA